MRTTVTIDDELISKAAEFSGIADKSKLINYTLDEYIKKMAARRLAAPCRTLTFLAGVELERIVPMSGLKTPKSLTNRNDSRVG